MTTRNALAKPTKKMPDSKKILVIEDEPVWRILLEKSIRLIHTDVELIFTNNAGDGFQALLNEGDFDLVISDLHLNGVHSGLDLWDRILDQDTNTSLKIAETPFILISGTSKSKFLKQLILAKRERMLPLFIQKPRTISEIVNRLRNLI